MNIIEIPNVETADLLFLNKVQLYYRRKHPGWVPQLWCPFGTCNADGTKPSEFRTLTFGVETE